MLVNFKMFMLRNYAANWLDIALRLLRYNCCVTVVFFLLFTVERINLYPPMYMYMFSVNLLCLEIVA